MNGNIFEVIVIGAGPAGLMCSYYLKHLGLEHILFDKSRLGESWRTQRWDTFRMVTPFKASLLPGAKLKTRKPDAYGTAVDMVGLLQEYVSAFQLPVTEQAQVLSIEKAVNTPVFQVKVLHDNETIRTYDAWQVIVAAGCSNRPCILPVAASLPTEVQQIHASGYRHEQQLKSGGVLVVGGGQSGLEIAQDLISQGRRVWLSSRPHPQLPRYYRGREIFEWLSDARLLDNRKITARNHRTPVITYELDDTASLTRSSLAARGVQMLGEMTRVDGSRAVFSAWGVADRDAANETSLSILQEIDTFIASQNINSPAGDARYDLEMTPEGMVLDLQDTGITNVVWATGYSSSFPEVQCPINAEQMLDHSKGLTAVEGFYVVGLNHSANSDYVVSARDQASFVSNHIYGILR